MWLQQAQPAPAGRAKVCNQSALHSQPYFLKQSVPPRATACAVRQDQLGQNLQYQHASYAALTMIKPPSAQEQPHVSSSTTGEGVQGLSQC